MNRPERTCIGCRGRDQKSELLRLVQRAGMISVDLDQLGPGRGAYLHRNPVCLESAVRRRAVGRAFRVGSVNGSQFASVVAPFVDIDGPPA